MPRFLNVLFLLITIVGIVFVCRVRTDYIATRHEYARLSAKVGRMPIVDKTKAHVRALQTDDPLDFAWHVYTPPNWDGTWQHQVLRQGRGKHHSMNSMPVTGLCRVRFRKIDGKWRVWRKYLNGSEVSEVSFGATYDQPQSLRIEQLGQKQVEVVSADEITTLLKITTDYPLQVGNASSRRDGEQAEPLFRLCFGSEKAFAKEAIDG